jgi:KTSC domain
MPLRTIAIRPSTNVADVAYDDASLTLVVTFHRNRRLYQFDQVPANVVAGFETSGLSAGKYFQLYVEGQYPGGEIT